MRKDRSFSVILNAFLAIFCLLAASGTAKAALSDGLVLQLHFNEGSGTTAYDSSGYGNNGTLESGVTWTTGISGSAANLDGTGAVLVPVATNLSSLQDHFTISLWLKTTDLPGVSCGVWGSPGSTISNAGARMDWNSGNGGVLNMQTGYWSNWTTAPGPLGDGKWHNIVFTASDNGGNTQIETVYQDGVLVNGTTYAHSIDAWPTTMRSIGGNGPARHFTGAIDEFSIYDRVLSQTEVTELYNGGAFAPVAIPAAAWLLGSGLMSLVGARRRFFRV